MPTIRIPSSDTTAESILTNPMRLLNSSRALRYAAILSLDSLFTIGSLYLAFLARFDGRIPTEQAHKLVVALPLLISIRLVVNVALGIHRWSFRMSGFHEAIRLVIATLCGSACLVALFYFFQVLGPPRSVIILEFFFTTTAMTAFRFSPRLASGWFVDQKRGRGGISRRTIIVGAGSAGDLLLRDLLRSGEHHYDVVGFVDDDKRKIGTRICGKVVLGEIAELAILVEKHEVTQVLIAIPRLSADRIRQILRLCSSLKVHFKMIPVSFAYLNDRVAASMLHDLSPEDLLPRNPAVFDPEEIRSKISGRRVLITGAAGSIGGEISRQVAAYGPESLVLLDINENELYFLFRELRGRHPDLKLFAEVADIREATRLRYLGGFYRPQHVFHAAAHKHVPLMEDAPEEAVKNNIFGTLNVANMAVACGAERVVLISTDKAVHPSSVMGATKRVAEFVIRDVARRARTRFTAVRFGNVLGSAGSVVPLFRQQIERGGPVTVTHPECTRYFMTLSEAASLVLVAGLGDYGELCILDMGQSLKIVNLASHMITMAGLVPGEDIKIEFTGLRPGEKLREELMTEEEERTHVVRDKIHAVRSPPPPQDLELHMADLRRFADTSDREGILMTLKRLIPTFQSQAVAERLPDIFPTAAGKLIDFGRPN